MKIVLLHGADAAEPPDDPVLGQIEAALARSGTRRRACRSAATWRR